MGLTLRINTKPYSEPPAIPQQGFSHQLTQRIMKSSWLYPSDYQSTYLPVKRSAPLNKEGIPVSDGDSFGAAFADVNLYERKKVTSLSSTLLKPLRLVCRIGAYLSIGLAAPAGVVYNGSQALREAAVVWYKNENVPGKWKKVGEYAIACLQDLSICLIGIEKA